ncbi:hypothetical protein BKA70DRAFT_1229193 [Coprinopsis sp. MPI-PUGE-AT-0042]|nr:hypothetical protein BKA70DRAFT_1229193 [Coprinopsis sp. MPI-PUGE-AT-0042]
MPLIPLHSPNRLDLIHHPRTLSNAPLASNLDNCERARSLRANTSNAITAVATKRIKIVLSILGGALWSQAMQGRLVDRLERVLDLELTYFFDQSRDVRTASQDDLFLEKVYATPGHCCLGMLNGDVFWVPASVICRTQKNCLHEEPDIRIILALNVTLFLHRESPSLRELLRVSHSRSWHRTRSDAWMWMTACWLALERGGVNFRKSSPRRRISPLEVDCSEHPVRFLRPSHLNQLLQLIQEARASTDGILETPINDLENAGSNSSQDSVVFGPWRVGTCDWEGDVFPGLREALMLFGGGASTAQADPPLSVVARTIWRGGCNIHMSSARSSPAFVISTFSRPLTKCRVSTIVPNHPTIFKIEALSALARTGSITRTHPPRSRFEVLSRGSFPLPSLPILGYLVAISPSLADALCPSLVVWARQVA